VHYQRLLDTRSWREIPGCPGRLVRREADPELDGWVLAHGTPFPEAATADLVLIWLIPGSDGGCEGPHRDQRHGVLSYRKPDGRLVHTLNTPEGLARKCAQLGVDLDGWIRRLQIAAV
jgi:hypothetical protein